MTSISSLIKNTTICAGAYNFMTTCCWTFNRSLIFCAKLQQITNYKLLYFPLIIFNVKILCNMIRYFSLCLLWLSWKLWECPATLFGLRYTITFFLRIAKRIIRNFAMLLTYIMSLRRPKEEFNRQSSKNFQLIKF